MCFSCNFFGSCAKLCVSQAHYFHHRPVPVVNESYCPVWTSLAFFFHSPFVLPPGRSARSRPDRSACHHRTLRPLSLAWLRCLPDIAYAAKRLITSSINTLTTPPFQGVVHIAFLLIINWLREQWDVPSWKKFTKKEVLFMEAKCYRAR